MYIIVSKMLVLASVSKRINAAATFSQSIKTPDDQKILNNWWHGHEMRTVFNWKKVWPCCIAACLCDASPQKLLASFHVVNNPAVCDRPVLLCRLFYAKAETRHADIVHMRSGYNPRHNPMDVYMRTVRINDRHKPPMIFPFERIGSRTRILVFVKHF